MRKHIGFVLTIASPIHPSILPSTLPSTLPPTHTGTPLWELLASLRQKRDARNDLILEKLASRTPPVVLRMEDVKAVATKKGDSPLTTSRVHIAQLLVEKGFATGVKDAFNKFLADDQVCLIFGVSSCSRFFLCFRG
jgi:hypothetical protein